MPIRGVTRHQIEHEADVAPMRLGNKPVETRERAEVSMHIANR